MGDVRLFGIRHHGPGSARSLLSALDAFAPDALLIEGPPEGDAVLGAAMHSGTRPPVAMLVYDPDEPGKGAFYPFAEFSPEWVAIRYGLERGIPVRMIDLPIGARVKDEDEEREPTDPLGEMAAIAGYEDHERWWDALVERRQDPTDVFESIAELMTGARDGHPTPPEEEAREAHMRLQIRKAKGEFERVAVVCGAWHVPALARAVPVAADQATLKGRPKSKHVATWVPWTYDRLGFASGYRAGVVSPAYYEHLWRTAPDQVASRWLLRTAHLLREEDLDASPASVIEAVRLADALCAIRGHAVPGLEELREAAWSVLCGANDVPMRIIERRLVVGERLGRVPEDTPQVPLQADLTALQRRLRLKPEALEKKLELDLRKDMDLDRSRLLHRLGMLSVPWGAQLHLRGNTSTFHEDWNLAWKPEFVIPLIEASRWGGTVEGAATAVAVDRARSMDDLPGLGKLAQATLLADLGAAIGPVMRRLESVAAVANDVGQLMDALPALAQVLRYGNVRRSDLGAVGTVFETLFTRACLGLPGACGSLDDEAAAAMAKRIDAVQSVVTLLEHEDRRELWYAALHRVADLTGTHGQVVGRAARHLLDAEQLSPDDLARRLGLLASPGTPPIGMAQWLEGFLGQSGQILLHDDRLFSLIDTWVAGLAKETFEDLLPLLRRTFSAFPRPERRQLGERAAGGTTRTATVATDLDEARAARVAPIVRTILGLKEEAR
ncbi:MAG: DUF5682 family protein [Fimbriimonas sp.]